jgi:hypothetical protein
MTNVDQYCRMVPWYMVVTAFNTLTMARVRHSHLQSCLSILDNTVLFRNTGRSSQTPSRITQNPFTQGLVTRSEDGQCR